MSEPSEKSKKKELYLELKELDQEIKKLNANVENIDEQISELESNKSIIGKFTGLKANDELRVPLVSGVYFKAKLVDTKSVMVNVGANVTVEKPPLEVVEILEGQTNELNDYRANLIAQMKQLIERIEQIQKEVE